MQEIGVVISLHDKRAEVEVQRKSACEGCHHEAEGCDACSLFISNAKHRVQANNPLGASVGDKVLLTATSGQMLFYAFLAFLLPLSVFLTLYFSMSSFLGRALSLLIAVGGMLLVYAVVGAFAKKRESKRCTVSISKIIAASNDEDEKTALFEDTDKD